MEELPGSRLAPINKPCCGLTSDGGNGHLRLASSSRAFGFLAGSETVEMAGGPVPCTGNPGLRTLLGWNRAIPRVFVGLPTVGSEATAQLSVLQPWPSSCSPLLLLLRVAPDCDGLPGAECRRRRLSWIPRAEASRFHDRRSKAGTEPWSALHTQAPIDLRP